VLLRVATGLPPDRYLIVAALHPHIWAQSGRRQLTQWNADCLRHGVRLLPPEEGWQAALIAADWIIGDHGSVTYYGGALNTPVLLGAFSDDDVATGSHIARLGSIAPRMDWENPLLPQLKRAAVAFNEDVHSSLRRELSSEPCRAAKLLRTEMYRLLGLTEPACPARLDPVPLPCRIRRDVMGAA
jgi:hypothetical protein